MRIVSPLEIYIVGDHREHSGAYCLALVAGGHVVDGVGVDVDDADQDGGQLPNHLLLLPPLVAPVKADVKLFAQ